MELTFDSIIDKFKGKKVYVLGLGPSLKENIEHILEVQDDDDVVIVSCNNCDIVIPEIKVDYWLWVNGHPVRSYVNKFHQKPESTLVWAESVDGSNKEDITKRLNNDHIPFNQWAAKKKNPWKGNNMSQKLIQKHLSEYSNNHEMYSNGHTVAVHMVSFAILLGANEVHITGVDMDYSNGYACNNDKLKPSGGKSKAQHEVDSHAKLIENDFRVIFESAKNTNCSIYSLNGKSKYINSLIKKFTS